MPRTCSRCGKRKALDAFYKQSEERRAGEADARLATRNWSGRRTHETPGCRLSGGGSWLNGATKAWTCDLLPFRVDIGIRDDG
jgi:hypothetical protein